MLLGLTSPCRNPFSCRAGQGVGQPGDDRHRLRGRQRPVSQPILQGAAGQELDDQERAAPPGLDPVDLGHGRMRHRRHGPGFRLQPPQAAEGPRRQDLDGHVALQTQVARQVDRAHTPSPQAPRQAELAGEQLRNLRGDVGRPAGACGRLAGLGQASADGTLLGRRPTRQAPAGNVDVPSSGPGCLIPGYPSPPNPMSLGLSWCPATVDFQARVFALQAAGASCIARSRRIV